MRFRTLSVVLLLVFLSSALFSASSSGSSRNETVINKKYPKKFHVEITPSSTLFLNQVYLDTFFVGGQISFYPSESFGIHLEGAYGFNTDLPSRLCLETFYNDINRALPYKCGYQYLSDKYGVYETASDGAREKMKEPLVGKAGVSLGPSYVPIREIKFLAALTFSWNMLYGKQLAFMAFTNYFDLYLKFGGGIALSDYYPGQIYIKGGDGNKRYRTDTVTKVGTIKDCPKEYGVCVDGSDPHPNWRNLLGEEGRPEALQEVSPLATLAFGYRFHFLGYLHLMMEIRSYFLIATGRNRDVKLNTEESSKYLQNVEHYLTVSGGLGVRL